MAQAASLPELAAHAEALGKALQHVASATQAAWSTGKPLDALANAVPYMQAFGHTVLAWIWLDVCVATLKLNAIKSVAAYAGNTGATRYFYHYELPKVAAWLQVVEARDLTCANFPEEAF